MSDFVRSQQIVSTKTIKVTTILASSDFVAGFKDARAGKPFLYDRPAKKDGWFYERGRQLALIYSGPLKEGRTVTAGAVRAYCDARRTGVIL